MTTPAEKSPHNAASAEDLDWLAFCYVAGELSDPELARFEALLAESQTARERLAAAVALMQAIADGVAPQGSSPVEPSVARSPAAASSARRRSRFNVSFRPIAWPAAAAALLLAAIWLGRQLPNRDVATATTSPNEYHKVELATAWASWLDEEAAIASGDPIDNAAAESIAANTRSATDDADEPLGAPDWMLAALGGEEASSEPPTDPMERDVDDAQTDPTHGDVTQDG